MDIIKELNIELKENLLNRWYPLIVDRQLGGFYSNVTFDWNISKEQEKMIVTQARHIWVLSKASEIFTEDSYEDLAIQGYSFLKDYMWDKEYGGFYQIRNKQGEISSFENWFDEKRVYGNAFAIYGLAALYNLTHDKEVLDLAIDTFYWIENHAYDPIHKGYFQFLTREGKPFNKHSEYKTNATDKAEVGFKDQNSSIHLLEAFTELYKVWPNDLLRERLNELLFLIRDTIVSEVGYLKLFFSRDWRHISFKHLSDEERVDNYGLDHVSFGHDYETAFLMLEASYFLGLKNDIKTLRVSKKLLDHAIENGWDKAHGGFFDGGYYFDGKEKCSIIKDTKTWWPQAEGLNALLLFSKIYPKESHYFKLFKSLWSYVKKYSIDPVNQGWYWGSIEKQPNMSTEPKGSIWKASYHDGRSLMNCLSMLDENSKLTNTNNFENKSREIQKFIEHWKNIAKS